MRAAPIRPQVRAGVRRCRASGIAGIAAALLVAALGGCRATRTIEEVEQARGIAPARAVDVAWDDPFAAGLFRIERLFVRDGELLGTTWRAALDAGGYHDETRTLAAGSCYAFAAWGEPDTVDIDLRVSGPGGQPVAWDDAPDNYPVVERYCPERDGVYSVRVSARGASAEFAGRVWRLLPGDARTAEDALEARARQRFGEGLRALAAPQTTWIREGRTFETALALRPEQCVVVGVWSAAHGDVDLEVLDGSGAALGSDIATDAAPAVGPLCAGPAGAMRRIRLRAYAGSGSVWWRVWETGAVAHPIPQQ
jgi:hypothetical protein